MNIDLCQPLTLPNEFVNRLKAIEYSYFFKNTEELFEYSYIATLIKDIDLYCRSNRIIGIHYTRAMPESIRSKGLLIRNGNQIRQAFLEEYGYLFSQEETQNLKKEWSNYFNCLQSSVRDERIFFNFTENELEQDGVSRLLEAYGGEQIGMPIERKDTLGLN